MQNDAGREVFLEAARRIGERLVAGARWTGDACTWTVMAPDRSDPASRRALPADAGPALYEGASGIAVFLGDLYRVTGDAETARAARGGIRHSLQEGAALPDVSFGLHGGRVGLAWAAWRVGTAIGDEELRAAAAEVLAPLEGNEPHDRGLDVIAGAAGGIPALLQMAETVGDRAVRMARRLGDRLVDAAERETGGWAWGTMKNTAARNLCGYAHGAAGGAHGLLELWHATGDGAYRYAAEQAMVYEDQFFSPVTDNWPDFRHNEVGDYLYQNRVDELRDALRRGETVPGYVEHYMAAWCHGAPGIAMVRARAWQLLGDERWRQSAEAALRATDLSLNVPDERANYSLCHGAGGNADALVVAGDMLGDPARRARAEEIGRRGYASFEGQGKPWPCGTLGAVSDTGLLLGEAGIGHFYLRLHDPSIPSVLFLTAPGEGAEPVYDGYVAARRQNVAEWFGLTLSAFEALGQDVEAMIPRGSFVGADVRAVHAAVLERIGAADPERRALLEDASRIDRERFDLSGSVQDHTREFLDALAREPDGEVPWKEVRIALSPRARLVNSEHDWGDWLASEDRSSPPEADDVFHLLQVTGGSRVTVRRLSPFAAVVLRAIRTPSTLDEVCEQVEDAISGAQRPARSWVEARVLEQVRQAYLAGFVVPERAVAAEAQA